MGDLKTGRQRRSAYWLLLPLCLSPAPLSSRPLIGTLLLCGSIFLAAARTLVFRHRENLAVFLLVWLCGIPANLRLTVRVIRLLGSEFSVLYTIPLGILSILLLFSIEEILFGIAARFCWRRQYAEDFRQRSRRL